MEMEMKMKMENKKKKILHLIDEAHHIIEEGHQELRLLKGEQAIMKQRQFLLADMACHLVQDAMSDDIKDSQSLKNRLYAILTICDDFLPGKELKSKAEEIIS
jgi:hypothetical protein